MIESGKAKIPRYPEARHAFIVAFGIIACRAPAQAGDRREAGVLTMHLEGVSCGERNSAMAQVRKAVHAVDGSINSHERYSDVAASVTFEIDGGRMTELLDLLAAADVRVAEGIGEYGHSGQVRCGLTIRFEEIAGDGPGAGETL